MFSLFFKIPGQCVLKLQKFGLNVHDVASYNECREPPDVCFPNFGFFFSSYLSYVSKTELKRVAFTLARSTFVGFFQPPPS